MYDELSNPTYDIQREEVSEACDGMFLLWDCLADLGMRPMDEEIIHHATSCESRHCRDANSHLYDAC